MTAPLAVIGVDAGGTKTAGALALADGTVIARSLDGPGNYQATGLAGAETTYRRVLGPLCAAAERRGLHLAAAAFGLSGLDRPRDAERLGPMVRGLLPVAVDILLVNDTFIILRAGSPGGFGVAVVSGTGSNCVAVGRDGRQERIGGLGGEFGDDGSADFIGRMGLRAAFRGLDGRGPRTALTEQVIATCGLVRLDDIIDRFIADAGEPLSIGLLAPIVFESARAGDAVARQVLVAAGEELGLCAALLAGRLFQADDRFPLVLGGSVLQKGAVDAMERALVARVHRDFPLAEPITLAEPPLHGAVLLALDAARTRETAA